jgi:hypothetical protein
MENRIELFKQWYINSFNAGDIDSNIWLSNYICNRFEYNKDQKIWFCFLNAISYQFPTSYSIIQDYPDCELVDIPRLTEWWLTQQKESPFQKDKLKQRKFLPESIESYQELVKGDESDYFDNLLNGSPQDNFNVLWEKVFKPIRHFGRFSVWNWAQMLKDVAGYDINPPKLFLGDSNAESITHGMCYVLGWDDKTIKTRWKDEEGKRRKKVYSFNQNEKYIMESVAQSLIDDLNKMPGIVADPFSLETSLCSFKKIFRERDSRYIGYYLDRQAEDIQKTMDKNWPGVDFSPLIEGRMEIYGQETIGVSVDKKRFKETYKEKLNV